jgi:hypothetical protein
MDARKHPKAAFSKHFLSFGELLSDLSLNASKRVATISYSLGTSVSGSPKPRAKKSDVLERRMFLAVGLLRFIRG